MTAVKITPEPPEERLDVPPPSWIQLSRTGSNRNNEVGGVQRSQGGWYRGA